MSTTYGELTVIVNPHAGKRRVGQEVPELERTLRARGLPYHLLRTEGRGDATRFAREALERGHRFIVAVGGDGTVHEVVNGMLDPDGQPAVEGAILGVVAA
ncbi:MAG TPA: acylglycerol kinase family protein, partial [Actinomycetota bacterium]|nr:acylglycerol kinase family protein [Actinomycetota bacterium]